MSDDDRPPQDDGGDDEWIEELGRRAGREMQQPPPESGLSALERRQRRRTARLAGAGFVATAVLVVGVVLITRGGDDETVRATTDTTVPENDTTTAVTAAASTAAPSTAAATTVAAASTTVDPVAPDIRWAADYLGVEPGPATGEPYKIGWLGEDTTNPGDRTKLDDIVTYLNTNVGGAGGRPIELVPCDHSAEGASASCAAQLAADPDIDLVLTDLVEYSADNYSTINATKAVGITWHASPIFVGSNAAVLSMDGPAGFRGMLSIVLDVMSPSPKKIVYLNDISASANAALGITDLFTDYPGAGLIWVDVANDASVDAIAEAIRNTPGAADADAYLTYGTTGPWCSNVPAARAQLGITAPLALMDVCVSTATEANPPLTPEQVPLLEGVYVSASGAIDLLDPRTTGLHVYEAATGDAGTTYRPSWGLFGAVMVAARIIDEHGDVDNITAADIRTAFTTYHGPVPLTFGPMDCGTVAADTAVPAPPATCFEHTGVYRYVDGELTAIANGRNGKLLGFSGLVDADPNLFPPLD